jgi:hypothetical protein
MMNLRGWLKRGNMKQQAGTAPSGTAFKPE